MITNLSLQESAENFTSREKIATEGYNRAYRRWLYGSEKDEEKNREILDWHRENYFKV